jgi:hypothetical protein
MLVLHLLRLGSVLLVLLLSAAMLLAGLPAATAAAPLLWQQSPGPLLFAVAANLHVQTASSWCVSKLGLKGVMKKAEQCVAQAAKTPWP